MVIFPSMIHSTTSAPSDSQLAVDKFDLVASLLAALDLEPLIEEASATVRYFLAE